MYKSNIKNLKYTNWGMPSSFISLLDFSSIPNVKRFNLFNLIIVVWNENKDCILHSDVTEVKHKPFLFI